MAHTVCGSGSVKWAERVFIALLALPVIGLIWQGAGGVSGQPIQAGLRYLAQEPALFQSITLTLCVAAGSVMLSLWATAWLTFRVVSASQSDRFLSLTLAIPHSALALGVLLFFGASGVLVRWLLSGSAEVTLPDYLFPKDRYGLGVLLVLVLKESAFLTLLAIPLARRLPLQASFHMTRECGWSDWQAWRRLVWPQVRRMLRAPILVVFAFSLANLEIALVLGSDQTPFVAVRMLRWLTDPSPVAQQAGAIAILALLLVLVFISLFWFRLDRALSMQLPSKVTASSQHLWSISVAGWVFLCGALVALLLWSVAGFWAVDSAWPTVTGRSIARLGLFPDVWLTTVTLGVLVAVLSVALAVVWLECMTRSRQVTLSWVWWGYLWMPALPMTAGLLGWLYLLGLNPGFGAVVFAHVLLALPYCLVVLSDAWLERPESERIVVAQSGLSAVQALWRVWIPKHSVSLLAAFAVAFSVSLGLYTQTLLLGGGRVETLITELVVNLSGDRRSAAAFALGNTLLPWVAFALTAWCGRMLWRNRRGMQGGTHARAQ